MLFQRVLLLQTFQLMPFCHGQVSVFLEQPGPGPVVAPIGTQVQLNCSVMEGYRIEWGITLPDQTVELSTDLPGVLDALRAQGIVVELPNDETSLLVINAMESTNGTAATCIAIDRNNTLAREESRQVQVFYYNIIAPKGNVSICLVEDITYSIQCSYITGNDARVCVYTLVSGVEGVDNITGTIDRNSSEGVKIDLLNVGDFIELLVLFLDRDDSISSLSVRLNITRQEPCEGDSRSGVVTTSNITFSVVAVILCIIITLTSLTIVCLRIWHRKHQVTNKSSCNSDNVEDDFSHGHEQSENTEVKYPSTYDEVELEPYENSENNVETKCPHIYKNIEPEQSQCTEDYFSPVFNVLEGKQEDLYSHLNFPQSENECTGSGEYEDVVVPVQNSHYKQGTRDMLDYIRMS